MQNQLRTLAFIVLFTIFSATSGAQTDQQLMSRYDKMYAAEKYELALKAATTITDRHPEAARWQFFAGALCARLDKPEDAIKHLKACAELKYSGISSFEQNSDLDPIRSRDDFQEILELVRSNAKARMDEFQREAKKHVPEAYYPPPNDERPALVLALHGTGMDGQSMFNALKDACVKQGVALIAPDGLRPSGNGFSWTYRDESKWFVNYLIEDAIANHGVDPDRVILVGFSQGANIALILGQTQADTFQAVVPICGHYEAQNASSDATPAPFYLLTGSRDPWKKTYVKAKKDISTAGGEVVMRTIAGKGHQLPTGQSGTREYLKAIIWSLSQE